MLRVTATLLIPLVILFNVFLWLLQESGSDDVAELTSKLSSVQVDKVSASSSTLKLPQLFNLTPNSSGKTGNVHKRQTLTSQTSQTDGLSERNSLDQSPSSNGLENLTQGLLYFLCTICYLLCIYTHCLGSSYHKLNKKYN